MIIQQLRNVLILTLVLISAACSTPLKQTNEVALDNQQNIQVPIKPVWSAKAIEFFEEGNSFVKTDSLKAIEAYHQAILVEPKMEPAYFNLMRLYYDTDDLKNIQTVLDSSQSNKAESARILSLAGSVQRQAGKFSAAEKLYMNALQLDENHLSSLANMGILQDLYLHKLPLALSYYEKYQEQLSVQGKEDKRLANWLADLKQRIRKLEKEKGQ